MHRANERRCYFVTKSLIGWAQTSLNIAINKSIPNELDVLDATFLVSRVTIARSLFEINIKITISWWHKQFDTVAHTLFYMDPIDYYIDIYRYIL